MRIQAIKRVFALFFLLFFAEKLNIKTKKKWRDMLFKWSAVAAVLGGSMLIEILALVCVNRTVSRAAVMLIRRDDIFILVDIILFLGWVEFWLFYVHEKFD